VISYVHRCSEHGVITSEDKPLAIPRCPEPNDDGKQCERLLAILRVHTNHDESERES
jgi:hypothetical protein